MKKLYEQVYAHYPPEYMESLPMFRNPDGSAESVVAAHSLIPQAMLHFMSGFGVLINPRLPLSRRQHEMIATLVSALNSCVY
ncbi:MAG: hypothetical protein KatS3mg105_1061 [Gemmatales bacterium]|nr:MAG: hypothetical protein KatS3mg105_1061 [Gemmatales bacterium]